MDIIANAASAFGNAPFLLTSGAALSFGKCLKRSAQLANALFREGVAQGKTVAIVSPNSPDLVLALIALLRLGAVAAPLNHRFPEEHRARLVERLSPTLLLTPDPPQRILQCTRAMTFKELSGLAGRCPDIPEFPLPGGMDRPVTIIHTSASSGVPKAALHSFGNHWHNALGANRNMPFGPGDCWLLSLPLCHVGGYALLFRSLAGGGSLALGMPDGTLEASLGEFPVTHLSLVPTQLYRLLRTPGAADSLRRLKALLLGGSAVPAPLLHEALREGLPLYLTYGSTEMGSQVTTTAAPVSGPARGSGSVLPFRELAIAGDGEILVKGPCLFLGYIEEGTPRLQRDDDGWFHTSDMGFLDVDGTLTVLGRKDSMFISGGENIHPEEIETALMDLPGIEQALVVPVPDREYGSRPAAFIRLSPGCDADDGALSEAVGARLGRLKSPVAIRRVAEWSTLPGSAKIDRALYVRLAREKDHEV
jgi:O-succinylbenzoic acid--CoA ligase